MAMLDVGLTQHLLIHWFL